MTSVPTLAPAPDVVERALSASRADGCVVIVREVSSVNARFAVNTATSNGCVRSREVTVVSVVDGSDGVAAASVVRSGAVDVVELVAASEALARSAPPAPDAAALMAGGADGDFAVGPPEDIPRRTCLGRRGTRPSVSRGGSARRHAGWVRRAHGHHHLPRDLSRAAPQIRPARRRVSAQWTHRGRTELRVVQRRGTATGGTGRRRAGCRGPSAFGMGAHIARSHGRTLRDHLAADRGRRPHDISLLDDVGPRRTRRTHRVLCAGRRDEGGPARQ